MFRCLIRWFGTCARCCWMRPAARALLTWAWQGASPLPGQHCCAASYAVSSELAPCCSYAGMKAVLQPSSARGVFITAHRSSLQDSRQPFAQVGHK